MTYRKKPLIAEAMRFASMEDYLRILQWMKDSEDTHALAGEVVYVAPGMYISTREGTILTLPGSWIVKNSNGEFTVCTNNDFEETYEQVLD